MRIFQAAILITFLFSCSINSDEPENQSSQNKKVYVDVPFTQEYHEGYLVDKENAAAIDVRAIQVDIQGNTWIATRNGIYKKQANSRSWSLMISGTNQGPAYDVKMDDLGNVWAATWNGIYQSVEGRMENVQGPKPPIAKIVVASEGIYALGPHGIWLNHDGS